jgi:hypothetical protein
MFIDKHLSTLLIVCFQIKFKNTIIIQKYLVVIQNSYSNDTLLVESDFLEIDKGYNIFHSFIH